MRNYVIKKNVFWGIISHFVSIVCGLIVPRMLIKSFGSETYGLTTSIVQFLNYVALFEGGVSSVIMASLYKPLKEKNSAKINGVVNATNHFTRQICLIYLVYMVCVAVVYSNMVKTTYTNSYVFFLTIVLGSNLFVEYCFSMTYRLLINADQNVFFVSIVNVITKVINTIVIIIAVQVLNDIIYVKLFGAIVYCIQPICFSLYVKKHYPLDKKAPPDTKALSQRWDGFGQNLAYFIHTNTDVVILTIFSSLSSIAVYSVYLMVANLLKALVTIIVSSIEPSLGNVLVGDNIEESNHFFDFYEFAIVVVSTILFSCGLILTVPFVRIYTKGINDANYIQPLFCIIILLAEWVYCIRAPYVSVVYAAGRFKQTAKYSYEEAIINIAISCILVSSFGLVGVACGTLVSMLLRMYRYVKYLSRDILYRPINKLFKRGVLFWGCMLIAVAAAYVALRVECNNFILWIIMGTTTFMISLLIVLMISWLYFRAELIKAMKVMGFR